MGAYLSVTRILTDYTTTFLSREVIDQRKYKVVHDALSRHLCQIFPFFISGQMLSFLHIVALVSREISPIRMAEQGAVTWADFSTVLKNVLVRTFGAHAGNTAAALRIAMFARNMWLELRGPSVMVYQNRVRLAVAFVQFILNEAAEAAAAMEIPEVADEAEDDVVEGPPDTEVVAEEPPEAEQEEEIGVTEAPPEPEVNEDGDETKEKSGSCGSKRRSQGLSYKEELKRESEAKRRYGLRNTRAREERMSTLKDGDAKRKVDSGTGSSSKGAQKKSRR